MQSVNGSFDITPEGYLTAYRGYESTVTVPDGVTKIGERAFWGARLMTRLVLPASLRTVGAWAFAGCTALREADLGGAEEIGAHAFFSCTSLSEARLPASLLRLGGAAFDGCVSLVLVTLPAGLAEDSVFR